MGAPPSARGAALALAVALLAAAPARAQPGPEPSAPLTRGQLLVATEQVEGLFFARSVVLLLDHGSEGSLGVVVNRPTRRRLAELLRDEEALARRDDRVWLGGPVALRRLLVLVRAGEAPEDTEPAGPGLWVSGSLQVLRRALAAEVPAERLRVFAGHAAWSPGQLASELARGDWSVLPADAEALFERSPGELWRELHRGAGRWARGPVPPPLVALEGGDQRAATRYAIQAGSSGAWRRGVKMPLPSFVARSVFSQ